MRSRFTTADLTPVAGLEGNEFSHKSDRQLRKSLAEVFYGTRWIYKLKLFLLTRAQGL